MNIELIVIFLIFLTSFILILKDFPKALNLLLILSVFLHKELFSFYRWDLMPIRAMMVAFLCAFIAKSYFYLVSKKENKSIKILLNDLKDKISDPLSVVLILLWLVRGISIIFTQNLKSSLLIFAFFTTVVIVCLWLLNYFYNHKDSVAKYLNFYVLIAFILSLFGYFQLAYYSYTGKIIGALWNIPGNIARVGSTFWDVNHYGAFIAVLLPYVGINIINSKNSKQRLLSVLIFASLAGSLLLTSSRTAWMIDFFAFIVFIAILFVRKFGIKGIGIVAGVLVLISIPLMIEYSDRASPFRAGVKQYFHYRMDSFDSHILLLTGSLQIFEKYPILGGGYGSFFEHFSKTKIAPVYFGRDPAALNTRVPAHTIWGEALSETGTIGFVLVLSAFTLIVMVNLYSALNSDDKKIYLYSASFASVIIGWGIAGIFYSYNTEFFWTLMILAWVFGYHSIKPKFEFSKILEYFVRSEKFILLFLIIISSALIFTALGVNHLIPWDEAIYAKIAKNMVETGSYLDMSWKQSAIWYEKPPLYIWSTAFFMKILGYSSLAARLTSAIFGFLTIILVYKFGSKMYNKTVGYIAALSLLTTFQYLYYARTGMLDVSATFFIALAIYIYYNFLQSENKHALLVLSGMSVGFAIMIKGVVGALPLPIILFHYLFISVKNKSQLKITFRNIIILLISCGVIALPWHIYSYIRYGSQFLASYIGYHVWDRATMAIEDKGRPFYWYFIVIKVSMRLWFIMLLASFPFLSYKTLKDLRLNLKEPKFLLIFWAVFIFVFFSVAKSKLVWYITPVYVPLALINAIFLDYIYNFFAAKKPLLNNILFKTTFYLSVTIVSITYLIVNKELVYTSDLTGSQSRLLMKKDEVFGEDTTVFLDRIELPIALYYTQGPFNVIDFRPDLLERVPLVPYYEDLILITKKGRFSKTVITKRSEPSIVAEDGDWVLWYFDSEKKLDKDSLNKVNEKINTLILNYSNLTQEELIELESLQTEKTRLETTIKTLSI